VGDLVALDDRDRSLQLDRGARQLIEEGRPAAEQDGDEIDPDLVEQAGVEALPGDRAAVDPDRLVTGELLAPVWTSSSLCSLWCRRCVRVVERIADAKVIGRSRPR
jgi:hypothetical protein